MQKARTAFDHMGSAVLASAAKGNRAAADDWIRSERRLASMLIERSDFLIELLGGAQLKLKTIGQAALVNQKLGDHAAFEREKNRFVAQQAMVHPSTTDPNLAAASPSKNLSLSDHYFLSAPTDLTRVDLAPHRAAEYALFDQLSLTIGLFAIVIVIAVQLLIAGRASFKARQRPALMFIGWKRITKIILIAVVIPAAVYLAYAWSPLSGRSYGVLALGGALIVEYSLVGLVIFALLRVRFDRAVRERFAELGVAPPPRGIASSRHWIATAITLGIASVIYIVLERLHIHRDDVDGSFSVSMAIGVAISACIWLFDLFTLLVGTTWKRTLSPAFSRRLAFVPVEIIATLALALLILPALQWRERTAVDRFQKPVPYVANEIENSRFRDLRAKLLEDAPPPATNDRAT
jgi:hypothetical protein